MTQITARGEVLPKMDCGGDVTRCSSSDLPDAPLMSIWVAPLKYFSLLVSLKILQTEGKLWQGARVLLHFWGFLLKLKFKIAIIVHLGKAGSWEENPSSAAPAWR